MSHNKLTHASANIDQGVLAQVVEAITGLRFGSIEIIVQDGKIVQIERKEKIRLNPHNKKGQG